MAETPCWPAGGLLGQWDLMADKETRDGVEEENVVSASPRGQQKTGDVRRRRQKDARSDSFSRQGTGRSTLSLVDSGWGRS